MAGNLWIALIGFLIVVLSINYGSTQDVGLCATPKGESGICMDIRSCSSLVTLIQTKPLPDEAVFYLQQSQCGTRDKTVLVCCPEGNLTNLEAPSVTTNSPKESVPPPTV